MYYKCYEQTVYPYKSISEISAHNVSDGFPDLINLLGDIAGDDNYVDSPFLDQNTCNYLEPCAFSDMYRSSAGVSFFHLNVRGLSANWESFKTLVCELQSDSFAFDFIGLSESYKTEFDNRIQLTGYHKPLTRNRTHDFRGGVALFIKDEITFRVREDISIFIPNIFESIFIECKCKSINIVVGVIYRPNTPPKADIDVFMSTLFEILEIVELENKNCIIMGDVNIDLLKYNTDGKTKSHVNNIFANGFLPVITKPTRVTHSSASLIDHIYSNLKSLKYSSNIIITDVADHYGITHIIHSKHKINDHNQIPKRIFSSRNTEQFIHCLANTNFADICTIQDVNKAYDSFHNRFKEIFNESFPIRVTSYKSKRIKHDPWMTTGLLKSSQTKIRLYRKQHKNVNDTNIRNYKLFNNIYNKLRRLAKQLYYRDRIEDAKHDMKETWKILNNLMGRGGGKSSNIKNILINGNLIENKRDMASAFNNFFSSIGNDTISKIPSTAFSFQNYLPAPRTNSIFLEPVTEFEVNDIILKLKPKNSSGFDEISTKLIKLSAPYIVSSLAHIINLSLLYGTVPKEMKLARVIPIYKKGEHSDISNYRPISLLPAFSKILERAMFNRVYKYLQCHNILFKHQYGFRKKHSTIHPVIHFLNDIASSLNDNNKEPTLALFCDLSKAFDIIDHNVLLYKLHHYGIRGTVHKWFVDYLSDRTQYVQIENIKSDKCNMSCGVPQGSILGPLLFLVFVNDIYLSCSAHILSFADDTTMYISHKNIDVLFESANIMSQQLFNWFCANRLYLNASKTRYMLISSPKANIPTEQGSISIGGIKLQRVGNAEQEQYVKFLGILLDEKLTWKFHIDYVNNKICRALFAIKQAKHFIHKESLLSLYNALIYPHLSYGILAWGNAYQSHFKRTVTLQKQAIRTINKTAYNSHTDPLCIENSILKFRDIYIYFVVLFMYDYEHGHLPKSFENIFPLNNERLSNYETRQMAQYHVPFTKQKTVERMPLVSFPRLFNEYKKHISLETSRPLLKHNIKHLLLANYNSHPLCSNKNCPDCN